MPPSATFDVLGTCFHFGPAIARISEIIERITTSSSSSSSQGQSQSQSQSTLLASALFHSWFYAGQRDFTYLSLSNSYTPILNVFTHTFRRASYIIGLDSNQITESDVSGLMEIMRDLPAREGLAECFEILRGAGWDVLVCTNGGRKGTEGYFGRAGVEGVVGGNVVSCDEVEVEVEGGDGDGKGVAKPDVRVYEAVNRVLNGRDGAAGDAEGKRGSGKADDDGDRWFVAAHSWDLIAARNAGFRTAWVAHEEGDACTELFGEFDVVAGSLTECAELMVKVEEGRGRG